MKRHTYQAPTITVYPLPAGCSLLANISGDADFDGIDFEHIGVEPIDFDKGPDVEA